MVVRVNRQSGLSGTHRPKLSAEAVGSSIHLWSRNSLDGPVLLIILRALCPKVDCLAGQMWYLGQILRKVDAHLFSRLPRRGGVARARERCLSAFRRPPWPY